MPLVSFDLGVAHPYDILAAPSLEEAVALGYEMATRYRAVAHAALDIARQREVEATRTREQLRALVDENRSLREKARAA